MCSSGNIKSNQVFFDDSKDNALLMLIIGLSDFLMMAACASMTEIKAAWYQFKNFTMYHCQNNCWLEHVLYCTVLVQWMVMLCTLPSLVTHYCFLSITRPFQKISILLPPQWKWQMGTLPSSDISRTSEVNLNIFYSPPPLRTAQISSVGER